MINYSYFQGNQDRDVINYSAEEKKRDKSFRLKRGIERQIKYLEMFVNENKERFGKIVFLLDDMKQYRPYSLVLLGNEVCLVPHSNRRNSYTYVQMYSTQRREIVKDLGLRDRYPWLDIVDFSIAARGFKFLPAFDQDHSEDETGPFGARISLSQLNDPSSAAQWMTKEYFEVAESLGKCWRVKEDLIIPSFIKGDTDFLIRESTNINTIVDEDVRTRKLSRMYREAREIEFFQGMFELLLSGSTNSKKMESLSGVIDQQASVILDENDYRAIDSIEEQGQWCETHGAKVINSNELKTEEVLGMFDLLGFLNDEEEDDEGKILRQKAKTLYQGSQNLTTTPMLGLDGLNLREIFVTENKIAPIVGLEFKRSLHPLKSLGWFLGYMISSNLFLLEQAVKGLTQALDEFEIRQQLFSRKEAESQVYFYCLIALATQLSQLKEINEMIRKNGKVSKKFLIPFYEELQDLYKEEIDGEDENSSSFAEFLDEQVEMLRCCAKDLINAVPTYLYESFTL